MAEQIREVMTTRVATLSPDRTLVDAAKAMRDADVGDVIVVEDERPVGIVTDRDIVVRGLADGVDPATTPVSEVCTGSISTIEPGTDTSEAVDLMRTLAVRRLPVVEDGRLVGVISIGDLAIESDGESALADISAAAPNN